MQQVLGQHLSQVVLIDDQQPAGEFPVQGTYDSYLCGSASSTPCGALSPAIAASFRAG
jgi:hypothetical protein